MPAAPAKRPLSVYAAIVVALLFWASAFPGIRVGLEAFTPGQVALLRFGTASLVLGAYALFTRMRLPALRDLPAIAACGFAGITIYHVALNYGEVTVASAAAALLIATVPVFTALLAAAFLRERLTLWGWAGIAVAFAGAAVVSAGEAQGGLGIDAGALLILAAAVAASVFQVAAKPLLTRYGALEFTAYAIWAGTVPMLVFAPGLASRLPGAPLPATLAVVYLGVFPGAIAYVLWSWCLARMPASALSSFLYAQPLNAALIAWVWIAEVPGPMTWLGGAVSIAGVVLVNTLGRAREPQVLLHSEAD